MRDVTPLKIIPWDGKKISQPGIYSGVPMSAYHGDLCVGPSVSSSGLRVIEDRSAEHYYDQSYLNPEYDPDPPSEAMIFGRAVHLLFLGEGGFRDQFCIRPETYPNDPTKPWNGNSKDCKAWLAQAELDGLQVLKPDWMDDIRRMAAKLGAHPTIKAGILKGLVEHTIVWPVTVPVTLADGSAGEQVVWLKSRPDSIPVDGNMIVDFKSAADASPQGARRAITDNGYHMQLALAIWGIRETAQREIEDAILVFQEKKKPHSINHKPLLPEALNRGHQQNLRSLRKFAQGAATGSWSGYDDDEVPADLMPWLESRLKLEEEHGFLPKMEFPALAATPLAPDDDTQAV